MSIELKSPGQFKELTKDDALLAYFSAPNCNVCNVLKPKIEELLKARYPKIKLVCIHSEKYPELAAENRVFTAPTILVFFQGREYIRKSRAIGLSELEQEIDRYYSMMFD